jgi:hypothetical protein
MPWIAVGGAVLSGMMGSSSKKKEASKQRKMMRQAQDMQFNAMNEAKYAMLPYEQTGDQANERLATLLGIASPKGYAPKPTRERVADEFSNAHYQRYKRGYGTTSNMGGENVLIDDEYQRRLAEWEKGLEEYQKANPTSDDPEFGSLLRNFTGDDLESEPGYQFRLSEGEKGVNRNLAARGGWDSGAALKSLSRYNQDYASNEYGNAFNRDASNKSRIYGFLSGTAGAGQNAAATRSGMAASGANSMANTGLNFGSLASSLQTQASDSMSQGIQSAIGNYIYGTERNRDRNSGVTGNYGSPADYGYSTQQPWYSR